MGVTNDPRPQANPFPGPQPYSASDRAHFHGRDAVARELTSMILAHRSIALFGPSGAGKSSLVQAAVLPALAEEHDFRVVAVDGWPAGEAPVTWLLEASLRALKLAAPTERLSDSASVEWIVEQAFYRSERPVLIVLDQIEQLLFAQRDADEVADFLDWLDRFASQPLRGLHLVLAMREDYLGRFRDRARGRHRLLDHGFRLGPMTVGESTAAMIMAASGGVPPQSWTTHTTRSLMLQVRVPGQSERDDAEVQTAFAQIVCRALFAQRADSDRNGESAEPRAEPILESYLEGTLADLGPLRGAAEQLLEEHLVAADGTRTLLTEDAARASELAPAADFDTILTNLERAAILRAEQHRGTRYFELGHDWLANRVFVRKQQRLARAAAEAREREREAEQRAAAKALERARAETRRARRVVAVVTTLGLLAVALGVVAWVQREAALNAEETAMLMIGELMGGLNSPDDLASKQAQSKHERMREVLAEFSESNPELAHREIGRQMSLADDAMSRGELEKAREELVEALAFAERFASERARDVRAQRDLATVAIKLGQVEAQAGDLAAARGHYQRALGIDDALLASSLVRLGQVEAHARDLAAARDHYERAFGLLDPLVKTRPADPETSMQLIELHLLFIDLAREDMHPEAREHAEAAQAILDAMAARGQLAGIKEREEAKTRVNEELRALTP
jgi:tetratricopeptide (TPR) repeat protein